jgi:competence protein ComEC
MAGLKVAFLDAGHGDFAYVETPLSDRMVIDVGTGSVVPSQFLSNLNTITELQVSHPHTDHFDDIIEISKKKISSFLCHVGGFSDNVIGWIRADRAKIAKLRELSSTVAYNKDAIRVGSGFLIWRFIPTNIDLKDPNTASLVTILRYNQIKILFGGDLPSAGWENLLLNPAFIQAVSGTTIFKVPHHGRSEGCCQKLFDLKTFKPQLCISSDKSIEKDNKNTAATDWYSKRATGCNVVGYNGSRSVLTTRSDGSIFIQVNEQGACWVYPHKQWIAD